MYFREDYVTRQIEIFARCVYKLIFGSELENDDEEDYESTVSKGNSNSIFRQIDVLLSEKKICQAENLLFDSIDPYDIYYLRGALDFYTHLNDLSDAELEESDFSREEILEGINDVMKIYNISIRDIENI